MKPLNSKLVPGLLAGVGVIGLAGCGGLNQAQWDMVRLRQDSLALRIDLVSKRLEVLDTLQSDVHKIRLLTDFVGAKLARQERASKERENQAKPDLKVLEIAAGASFAKGPESAAVTMVTFTDYQCPYCRQVAPVLDSFARLHAKDLRWIAKNFPLEMHADAKKLATAVIAAGRQGRYFEYQSKLMAGADSPSDEDLSRFGRELKLDMKRFKADRESPQVSAPLLAEEINQAVTLGVKGTPSVFLNGRQVRPGSLADLEKAFMLANNPSINSQEEN